MAEVIRVFIVNPHPIARRGLIALLSIQSDMEVVGEATDVSETVEKVRYLQPDVLLIDLILPRQSGVQAIREIRQTHSRARILVFTSLGEDEQMLAAFRAGALGCVPKEAEPAALLQAIRDVYQGKPVLDFRMASELVRQMGDQAVQPSAAAEALTDQEMEVLRLVAQGLSNQDIARVLHIACNTTETHISHIFNKLRVENRTQAALYAVCTVLTDGERD